MGVIHVNTKLKTVGFEISEDTPPYDVETFVKMLMDNGYWVKVDHVPETFDSLVWIKAEGEIQ